MRVKKIHNTLFIIYNIVIIVFFVEDKSVKAWFLKKIFLLANMIIDIAFKMLLFYSSNRNVNFSDLILIWRIYTIRKALSTIK